MTSENRIQGLVERFRERITNTFARGTRMENATHVTDTAEAIVQESSPTPSATVMTESTTTPEPIPEFRNMAIKREVLAALRTYKEKDKRKFYDRWEAMKDLSIDLANIYQIPPPIMACNPARLYQAGGSGNSFCMRMGYEIKDMESGAWRPINETDDIGNEEVRDRIKIRSLIVLNGRLSIVTLLHEFAHANGRNEEGAQRWAVSAFKKVYPERMEKLQLVWTGTNWMLINPSPQMPRAAAEDMVVDTIKIQDDAVESEG